MLEKPKLISRIPLSYRNELNFEFHQTDPMQLKILKRFSSLLNEPELNYEVLNNHTHRANELKNMFKLLLNYENLSDDVYQGLKDGTLHLDSQGCAVSNTQAELNKEEERPVNEVSIQTELSHMNISKYFTSKPTNLKSEVVVQGSKVKCKEK